MKTKRLITRWLALVLFLAATLTASAYDFMVGGVAYNILAGNKTVEVTFSEDPDILYDAPAGTDFYSSLFYYKDVNYKGISSIILIMLLI